MRAFDQGRIEPGVHQHIDAAAAGQADIEEGRAGAEAQNGVPVLLQERHCFGGDGALEAAAGEVAGEAAVGEDCHLRADGAGRAADTVDQRQQGTADAFAQAAAQQRKDCRRIIGGDIARLGEAARQGGRDLLLVHLSSPWRARAWRPSPCRGSAADRGGARRSHREWRWRGRRRSAPGQSRRCRGRAGRAG